MKIRLNILFGCLLTLLPAAAQQTSVAGFYPLPGSGRVVCNFNPGWRFLLGDAENAASLTFDDSKWETVSVPHTSRLEPAEVSGCRNYQGVSWYRKTFVVPADMAGKLIEVHFEAIMGKQDVYVNGKHVLHHLGGYLPVTVGLTEQGVQAGDTCLIAVRADNSDDPSYPPGKKQTQLDFAYHGGMYRDVWLIGRSSLHVTDALERGQVAGGGVFVHYGDISAREAEMMVDVDVADASGSAGKASVRVVVRDAAGKAVASASQTVARGASAVARTRMTIRAPHLWSPENPYLYQVEVRLLEGRRVVDGGMVRAGIRKAEFRGKDGFWLNDRPYHQLIGGNRHQDFAYVGNALPNSQQWRDALRLKEAGMDIVRAAHYPQDPAFMDACDELGIFVIVPTPGWQYWNKDPHWAEMVHDNTRLIIRRDRNHPCVLMWEPILNETRYPEDFALKALQITREEYPYPGRPVAAADLNSAGVKEHYDVLYDWADNIGKGTLDTDKCIFTREWGEYVDDWYAHNAINRAARPWGEHAMLQAALSLADTYGMMYRGQRQFIGGCQWHPFDHQRGYHPDAYVGGIYDAFRQKKYAFEMFRSQRAPGGGQGEPFLFIAHELTQFSPSDVVVFSNCDSVRLTALDGWKQLTLPVVHSAEGVPNAPVVFPGFWNFWEARNQSYTRRNWQGVKLVAEGLVADSVVCRETKMPSRRSTRLRLYADEMGRRLRADGSDFVVVVAEVTDDNGNVRRLARESVFFSVEGEGELIGGSDIQANPRLVEWGSAPALVRSTRKAGTIRIVARPLYGGTHAPQPDTLTIESVAADDYPMLDALTTAAAGADGAAQPSASAREQLRTMPAYPVMSDDERRRVLQEVERQQQDFGIQ